MTLAATLIGCKGKERTIKVAAGTTLEQSGFIDEFIPLFEEETGIEVKVISAATGAALEYARSGDVDLLFIHNPGLELEFMEEGGGIRRSYIMHNYFYLVGPPGSSQLYEGLDTIGVHEKIYQDETTYVSRDDRSGTHLKELSLWEAAGLVPSGEWYKGSGKGMGPTLQMAGELGGVVLCDMGSWFNMKDQLELEVIIDSDEALINKYHTIVVSNELTGRDLEDEADKLVEWLLRDDIQEKINEFGLDTYGVSMYTADGDN